MKRSSRPRTTAELSKSLNHQLNTYALAAGAAGVAMLALAPPVDARIVYTPAHVVIDVQVKDYFLDLNHNGISDFYFYPNFGCEHCADLFVHDGMDGSQIWSDKGVYGTSFAAALPRGVRIGPRKTSQKPPKGGLIMVFSTCKSGHCYSGGPWLNVRNRYLGLAFKIHGKTHYGWARLNVRGTNYAVLTGYAYETIPHKAIITGKTHGSDVVTVQPASLGHLATGASALPAWRVKRTGRTTH